MEKRKGIRKSVRFEVFKRDKFSCQYCGNKSPDVVLHVDHIKPVAEGGTDDILNLLTACVGCNLGKGARSLTDTSAVMKTRDQMEVLQDRREQLEMIMHWQASLANMDNQAVDVCVTTWDGIAPGLTPNERGRSHLRRWIKSYGITEVIEAMNICSKYLVFQDNRVTKDSWEEAFMKISTVCKSRKLERENPLLGQAYHLRNIFGSMMRKSGYDLHGRDYPDALKQIQLCQEAGLSFEEIVKELGKIRRPNQVYLIGTTQNQ